MLQIIKNKKVTFILSGVLVVASLISLISFGLKPGIDFTGGSLIELSFTNERPQKEEVQTTVNELDYGSVSVQAVDEDSYLLKLKFLSEDEHQVVLGEIRNAFETEENKVIEERVETIGPAISSQLRKRAFGAGIAVVLAIVLYVAYAFRSVSKKVQSWKYGLTAIIALVHDVLIVTGVFAILGHYAGIEVDIPFVVALLTILGYSVNDTIVVFDRVRENLLLEKGRAPFAESVNKGVNDSLTRSLNTSLTTLAVLVALYLFGGASIKYFSLALIIGIISGTYSSIFLASPILVWWHDRSNKKK